MPGYTPRYTKSCASIKPVPFTASRFSNVFLLILVAVLLSVSCARHEEGIDGVASWRSLKGWKKDKHAEAWPALLQSCKVMPRRRKEWKAICDAAVRLKKPDDQQARVFFETWFVPYKLYNAKNGRDGLITGYYEPLLEGSKKPSKVYRHPVYKWPENLLVIDLTSLHPDLKGKRLRGRVVGRRVIPYFDRAQIEKDPSLLKGNELVWVRDPVGLFFLQIQGSGRIKLESGEIISVGYEQQNGHPYVAIGKTLIDMGELKREEVSLDSIRDWLKRNPEKAQQVLNSNPSYVFFKLLDKNLPGPLGAMGLPLTARRSIAVDRKFVPLGNPVWLQTDLPTTDKRKIAVFRQLMFAQDTGGAIRGGVRADVFWGFGQKAEFLAGNMKQKGKMYILLPKPGIATGNSGTKSK